MLLPDFISTSSKFKYAYKDQPLQVLIYITELYQYLSQLQLQVNDFNDKSIQLQL